MGETVREELLEVDGAGVWRCLMERRWSTLDPDQVLSTQNKFSTMPEWATDVRDAESHFLSSFSLPSSQPCSNPSSCWSVSHKQDSSSSMKADNLTHLPMSSDADRTHTFLNNF